MAINLSIYSNANSSSNSVVFDFVGDVLASSHDGLPYSPTNASSVEYYFKVTTNARQDNGNPYPAKIVRSLDELVLNRQKQSRNPYGDPYSTNAYSDVKSMVVDYAWDYINGHDANEDGTGVKAQNPMRF